MRAADKTPEQLGTGSWVYFPDNDENNLPLVKSDPAPPKDEAKPNAPRTVKKRDYYGRPGQIVPGGTNEVTHVEYKLGSTLDTARTTLAIPSALLRKCPAEQDEVGSGFEGVIRVWNGTEAMALDRQSKFEGKVGDKVTVEVKDFDRWLFVQLDFGRFREDLADVPPDLQKYVQKAVDARRAKVFFMDLKHVNQRLRVEMKDSSPEVRKKAWAELREVIAKDPILKEVAAAIPNGVQWDAPDEADTLEKEVVKLETQFGPLTQWQIRFCTKRYHELTLTLNGVVLRGVRPLNPFNEAEVTRARRPSFRDDTYQWIRFDLERRTPDAGAGTPKPDDVANAAAWKRLLGRPKLSEPMRVTLTVPEADLEMRSKVNPDLPDAPQFHLVGIEANVLYATLAVFATLLFFLAWLARRTNILRDSSGNVRPDGIQPVSLAKTQMAFWFILTAGAFAFLWVTMNDYNVINKTCLVLLGIGATTALAAAFIPSQPWRAGGRNYPIVEPLHRSRSEIEEDINTAIVDRLRQLRRQMEILDDAAQQRLAALLRKLVPPARLDAVLAEFKVAPVAATVAAAEARGDFGDEIYPVVKSLTSPEAEEKTRALVDELAALTKQKRDFNAMAKSSWRRLFADWLSENPSGESYDFHRFQMLAWTLLLGLVFIAELLRDRAMPEFSDTTLTLLGISGGTYSGFKLQAALAAKKEAAEKDAKTKPEA